MDRGFRDRDDWVTVRRVDDEAPKMPTPIERVVVVPPPDLPEGAVVAESARVDVLKYRAAMLAEKLRLKQAEGPETPSGS